MCIALDSDVDGRIVVVIVKGWLVLVDLGELNPAAGLLLERLNGGTSFTNDVGSCRLRDRDLDGLL